MCNVYNDSTAALNLYEETTTFLRLSEWGVQLSWLNIFSHFLKYSETFSRLVLWVGLLNDKI